MVIGQFHCKRTCCSRRQSFINGTNEFTIIFTQPPFLQPVNILWGLLWKVWPIFHIWLLRKGSQEGYSHVLVGTICMIRMHIVTWTQILGQFLHVSTRTESCLGHWGPSELPGVSKMHVPLNTISNTKFPAIYFNTQHVMFFELLWLSMNVLTT